MAYDSNSQGSSSPLVTPTQLIHDPEALESFIQLLSQKKKLEEDHAQASIALKELEWALQWKRWKLEAAKFAGKPNNESSSRGMQQMLLQYEHYLSKHKQLVDKVNIAKKVLDFNDKEIDLIGENCLHKMAMEDPFLTVTLREFLYYKSLEREVSSHKSLENYHQKMSLTIFKELLKSETMLGNSFKFQNYIYDCLQDRDGVTEYIEAKQNEILNPLFGGEISLKVSSTNLDQPEFPPTHLLQSLWDLMRSPVVEYESNGDGDTNWENHHRVECAPASLYTTPMFNAKTCCGNGQGAQSYNQLNEVEGTMILYSSENEDPSENLRVTLRQHSHHPRQHQHQHHLQPQHQSMSTDGSRSHQNGRCSPIHTPSMDNSSAAETRTNSSNDLLTIHPPKQYVSVESLCDRGGTARTVPFSAVPSEESAATDEVRTRATTATDFEEAIRYSNSNLLEYQDERMKMEAMKNSRINKNAHNSSCNRPTTTTVNKTPVPVYFGHTTPIQIQHQNHSPHQYQQPWQQNNNNPQISIPPNMEDSYYCYPGGVSVLGDHETLPLIYDNAQVQVSETDLLDSGSERPLTFCYPNNYSNDRVYPFYPEKGDR